MTLLRGQPDISGVTPMPVERIDDASTVTDVAGATLTWSYNNSGTWASATGQAAGTIVVGKTLTGGILNSIKSVLGSYNDTSLSLGADTRFNSRTFIPEDVFAKIAYMSPADQVTEVGLWLTVNGQFAIDHRRGMVWGKPRAIVANDTVSYSYLAPVVGSGGPAANVNVNQWGGTATTIGQKAMAASVPVVLASDQSAIPTSAAGASPQSLGTDATGQDAYATVKTPSANATHLQVGLGGANDAIISLDGGVTDHLYIYAGTIVTYDNILIANGVAIQAKNAVGGSNYSNLRITIW